MGLYVGPSGCVSCHGTKCPLLTALFFSLLSPAHTFLPEGVIIGFRNFAWGLNSQKKDLGRKQIQKVLRIGGAEGLTCGDPGARNFIGAREFFSGIPAILVMLY